MVHEIIRNLDLSERIADLKLPFHRPRQHLSLPWYRQNEFLVEREQLALPCYRNDPVRLNSSGWFREWMPRPVMPRSVPVAAFHDMLFWVCAVGIPASCSLICSLIIVMIRVSMK